MSAANRMLEEQLEKIASVPDGAWMASLSERKRREVEFHDQYRARTIDEDATLGELDNDARQKYCGNRKYYSATNDSRRYTATWIEDHAAGKIFLDYACGNGRNAMLAARSGAKLSIGIDISAVSVENATRDAAKEGVGANTRFIQADAENTMLPDNSIDAIICSGMLHHLDLSFAFPELRRILKPGGKLLAVEALDYNPAIKLYRKATPAMRTEWEEDHILNFRDVRFAKRFFALGEVRYWHILAILSPHIPYMSKIFERIDRGLTRIPFLRRLAWIFTFELVKEAE